MVHSGVEHKNLFVFLVYSDDLEKGMWNLSLYHYTVKDLQ